MIQMPNRMLDLRDRIEAGESIASVDVGRLALLMQLDVAVADTELTEQAILKQEAADDRLERGLEAIEGAS